MQKKAEQGDAEMQHFLGMMYWYGYVVVKDEQKAVEWFQKLAEQGYVTAMRNLVFIYADGRVALDEKRVLEWYRTAKEWYQEPAEQGNADAQYFLGKMYWAGRGFAKEGDKATEWLQKSAIQGHEKAKKSLDRLK